MRTRVWCVAVALALASAPADAQIVLSEAEALARLSAESPRVRAIRAAVDVARADVLAVSRWPNPRVAFDRESVAGVTEEITTIAQPLPISGRRQLDASAASATVSAVSSRADDEVRRARADLRLAFADLVSAQVRERELARARDRLRELTGILAKREAAGDAAGFDRLRAEREVVDIEADMATAAAGRGRAQTVLVGFFAGRIEPSTIVAADPSTARPGVPPVDALIEQAEVTRGELLAFRHEVEAARFSMRAADRRRIPEPELIVGRKSSTAAGGDLGTLVSVQAVLPLFDRSRAERALATAQARQAEARADAFRVALRSQIAALRATVIARRETANRYRAAAVSIADQVERIAQVSYEAGERGILELLDAHRVGAAARVRQAALDAGVRQAEIELEFVSGWETP